MWKCNSPVGDSVIVRPTVLSHDAIPVFIVGTGTYPSFVNDAGERHTAYPHVEVSLAEKRFSADRYVSNYYITAYSGKDDAARRKLAVIAWNVPCGELRTAEEIQALIDSLANQIVEAVERCNSLDDVYAAARQRLSILTDLVPECQTRAGYERACAAAGVDALSDGEIAQSYGVAYGVFSFPEYQPDHIIMMRLAAARKDALEKQLAVERMQTQRPATAQTIERGGQLWEPCECGREPVYMPLHLCAACWPKS